MPWKGEKDPYRIWLSEIILQQTRVEQGTAYYEKIVRHFPDIKKLASAPDEKVFKLWEGLGYYSRCRNLLATARHISETLDGKFPDKYEDIKALKGIGPYTAAAISSFAYNLPYAVVDGNVFRVLARLTGKQIPIDSVKGKKYFTKLAGELLDEKRAGSYNQAIMDFGATVCKPIAPLCGDCVFKKYCAAYLGKKTAVLPVKEKKIKTRKRWFYYLLLEHNKEIAIRRRNGKDIWQGLYEFPLIEASDEINAGKVLQQATKEKLIGKNGYQLISTSPKFRQQLSHQLIEGRFITVQLRSKSPGNKELKWMKRKAISRFAFPRFINQYLEKII